ncbi:hypothetical protein Trydic_g2903 [Trypoxylus dichotomus]
MFKHYPTCPWIKLKLTSFSAFAPTNLQYNSGPSVSSPHVADAYILLPSAKLKYGGVRISPHTAFKFKQIANIKDRITDRRDAGRGPEKRPIDANILTILNDGILRVVTSENDDSSRAII